MYLDNVWYLKMSSIICNQSNNRSGSLLGGILHFILHTSPVSTQTELEDQVHKMVSRGLGDSPPADNHVECVVQLVAHSVAACRATMMIQLIMNIIKTSTASIGLLVKWMNERVDV